MSEIDPKAPFTPVISGRSIADNTDGYVDYHTSGGISVRAEFAARFVAAMISNPNLNAIFTKERTANSSVQLAEALIERLNQE